MMEFLRACDDLQILCTWRTWAFRLTVICDAQNAESVLWSRPDEQSCMNIYRRTVHPTHGFEVFVSIVRYS
jgi:hypothetical protein